MSYYAGTRWPSTPQHPPRWWLAAEIIAEYEEERFPEDEDPRVFCARKYPDLHAAFMRRISEYAKHDLTL